ncbi:MAG: endopeptidase La [Mollicutes bacterium]|nr:endopeptidase La [Mollicutes bacterium]
MNNQIPVLILHELIILPNQELKLDLSNELSKRIIKVASKDSNSEVLIIAPRSLAETEPSIADLPTIGVVTNIKSKIELSNGKMRVVLRGKERVRIEKYYQNPETNILKCSISLVELPLFDKAKEKSIRRKLISLVKEYISKDKSVSNSIVSSIEKNEDLNIITDIITSFIPLSFNKKLEYMECINPLIRATNLIDDLNEEISINAIDDELNEKLEQNLESSQREYILREKLKEINNELGLSKESDVLKYNELIDTLKVNKQTKDKLYNEVHRLSSASEYSPEAAVIKNYLDTVINLPWDKEVKQTTSSKEILNSLNQTHYGLDNIKERILEYVELKNKNPKLKSPIICFVGPQGVGKTSIAMSIASALNRNFYKISVGGLNDSTELIGSRRTYLGAAPGKIIQGILKCKSKNPLILIDEVDKMVKDYKGDPASTMLEILDETQNHLFTDNYIEEPFDISNVMFILTANSKENIPEALLDRLEIIELSSYSVYEKIDIARNYLVKDIFEEYKSDLKINKEVIEYIVVNYTKEPGVRELKKILEKLIRKVCVYDSDYKSITTALVNKYLGLKKTNFLPNIRDFGIANVLACINSGGLVSHVQVAKASGKGDVIVTGNSGDILKESVQVVLGFLLSQYDIKKDNIDIYVHFLENAKRKEGPSAGVAIAVALLSMFEKKLIPSDVAFTGELTLKGDILPVGGIKEKILASSSSGIQKIFIPKANENDLIGVPIEVLDNIVVRMVNNFSEVYEELFYKEL